MDIDEKTNFKKIFDIYKEMNKVKRELNIDF